MLKSAFFPIIYILSVSDSSKMGLKQTKRSQSGESGRKYQWSVTATTIKANIHAYLVL